MIHWIIKVISEVLLATLSSLAEDKSRFISGNCTWRIRRQFEQGKVRVIHKKFFGYDKDEDRELIINQKEAKIIKGIYIKITLMQRGLIE